MSDGTGSSPYPVRAVTSGSWHHFLGAGPASPWSMTGRYLLVTGAPFGSRAPAGGEEASIRVIDQEGKGASGTEGESAAEPIEVGRTGSWNWRRGAGAQWMPWPSEAVIYNAVREGQSVSVLRMLQGTAERVYDMPVACLAPAGNKAICMDFRRLGHYRPELGYASESPRGKPPEPAPAKDGLWTLDLNSGARRLIVSYSDLHEWTSDSRVGAGQEEGAYVSRVAMSSDGLRLAILYHTVYSRGRIHAHLITASSTGSRLFCVSKGQILDFSWMPDGRMLVWAGPAEGPEPVRGNPDWWQAKKRGLCRNVASIWWARSPAVRARLANGLGLRYRIFKDEYGEVASIDPSVLWSEGHPSFSADGQWMALDTGPDAYDMVRLGLVHLPARHFVELGRYLAPDDSDEGLFRGLCPFLNIRKKQVVFESSHEGTRQVYRLDLPDEVFAGK